jgi:hypothetical protein
MTTTPEKIETTILSHLAGRRSKNVGSLVELGTDLYKVVADDKTFIVDRVRCWRVSFRGFVGIDPELFVAAANALDGGTNRDVSSEDDAVPPSQEPEA